MFHVWEGIGNEHFHILGVLYVLISFHECVIAYTQHRKCMYLLTWQFCFMVFILTTEGCTERSLQKIACYSIVCNNEI